MLRANLEGATLTGACLWETQRSYWNIKNIICENVYWSKNGSELKGFSEYGPGEFEKAYAQNPQIELDYQEGISQIEMAFLPHLIEKIQNEHAGVEISIRTIENVGGRAKVRISVVDKKDGPAEEFNAELETITSEFKRDQKLITEQLKSKSLALNVVEQHNTNLLKQVEGLKAYIHSMEHPEHKETKALTVLFLDLKGFSKLSGDEQLSAMKSTRHYAEGLLCEVADEPNMGKHANTWGDAIFVGFENPNSGIEFALSLIEILRTRKIVARIGMGFGELSIVYNATLKKMAPEGPALSEGARLEPLAEPGQLLISATLRGKNLDETRFVFTQEEKPLKKDVGELKAGEVLKCYSVIRKLPELT